MSLDAWKKLVAAPVHQLLKPRGFRKSGSTFSAPRSGVTLLVSFQSSTGSTKESLKITCNLAIRVDQLARNPTVSVWDAQWRYRIGHFLPKPNDYWWICTSDEDARRSGQEIAALLAEFALPTMESLASPTALANLWLSGQCTGITDKQRVDYLEDLKAAGIIPDRQ